MILGQSEKKPQINQNDPQTSNQGEGLIELNSLNIKLWSEGNTADFFNFKVFNFL